MSEMFVLWFFIFICVMRERRSSLVWSSVLVEVLGENLEGFVLLMAGDVEGVGNRVLLVEGL